MQLAADMQLALHGQSAGAFLSSTAPAASCPKPVLSGPAQQASHTSIRLGAICIGIRLLSRRKVWVSIARLQLGPHHAPH